jgi:hypothetical protein
MSDEVHRGKVIAVMLLVTGAWAVAGLVPYAIARVRGDNPLVPVLFGLTATGLLVAPALWHAARSVARGRKV